MLADVACDGADHLRALDWLDEADATHQPFDPSSKARQAGLLGARAHVLTLSGETDSALAIANQAYDAFTRSRYPSHGGATITRYRLGLARLAAGRDSEAGEDFVAVAAALPSSNLYVGYAQLGLAWLNLFGAGPAEALASAEQAAGTLSAVHGAHPALAEVALLRALSHAAIGAPDRARTALSEAQRLRNQHFGQDHALTRLLQSLRIDSSGRGSIDWPSDDPWLEASRIRKALSIASTPAETVVGTAR